MSESKRCSKCKEDKLVTEYRKNRTECKQCSKKFYIENKERINKKQRAYYEESKDRRKLKVKAYLKKYEKTRRSLDVLFRIKKDMRTMVGQAHKRVGVRKRTKTMELLGCSIDFFRTYMEARFKPGMSWDNRREWHIDHITPLATAKNEEDVIKLCHYTNLQPLWAIDNLRKGARIESRQEEDSESISRGEAVTPRSSRREEEA